MRVLFLTQVLPYPLDAGPKVRAYYVLRYLAERHRVTLLTFARPDDPPEAIDHLRQFCAAVHTVSMRRSHLRNLHTLAGSVVSRQSFVIGRDYVLKMRQKVDELLATGQFAAVHADQLWMARYALQATARGRDKERGRPGEQETRRTGDKENRRPVLVLDEHNACHRIFQRLARGERNPLKRALLEREWRALARYEAWACSRFDHVVTVTDEDHQVLLPLLSNLQSPASNPHFTTIPICVDPQAVPMVEPVPGAKDVLQLGTMFFLPNIEGVLWFAHQVWPQVIAQVPQATLTIVGKNPPRSVRQLQNIQRAKVPTCQRANGIVVTGYVLDPRPYLERAAIFIVPLHSGGGMRVKILDAWCWGLPVISTRIGAEGIDCRDGENILIADDADSFAAAVVRVLRDTELAQRLRSNGRRWVEEHYDWRKVYSAWDEVYEPSAPH